MKTPQPIPHHMRPQFKLNGYGQVRNGAPPSFGRMDYLDGEDNQF